MTRFLRIVVFFVFYFLLNGLQAQDYDVIDSTLEEDEERPVKILPDGKYRFGIKLGTHFSTLLGDENPNNALRFGINGGVYVRRKFKSQVWGYQLEVNGSLRGSNFSTANNDEYNTLRLVYIDMPMLLFFNLSKDESQKVLVGPQLSYLLTGALYKYGSSLPIEGEPKIKNYDALACIGYQINAGHVAIQTMIKYGFLNINEGLIANVKPLNQGKNMNNFMFELNLLF
jgi:hypothetical protein